MIFCSDIDLLAWEPAIFRDAAFASQLLASGSGSLAGAAFTASAGSFIDHHVAADQVIVLAGSISGSYPILSVDSATELTLSVLYDGLAPAEGPPVPSPIGTAAGLSYAVRTFFPQRQVVGDLIARAVGLEPARHSVSAIVNVDALRRPSALGTLQMIYSALAAAAAEPATLAMRAQLYERLYRRALWRLRVELDLNGDGRGDCVRGPNVLELRRH